MTRKDGRQLVWDHPVTAEDEIEYYDGPIPEGGIACRLEGLREDSDDWMDQDAP